MGWRFSGESRVASTSLARGSDVVSAKPREAWVDTAKGIAIILVVFLHATFDLGAGLPEWNWMHYDQILETFRLPLFFFTAGLFGTKALSRTLPGLLHYRVTRLIWLYLLWSVIDVTFAPFAAPDVPLWVAWLLLPVQPFWTTWFIYGIAVYFVVAWLLKPVPMWLQLLLAAALAIVVNSGLIYPWTEEWQKICQYFVFYLLAIAFGRTLRERVPGIRWPYLLIAPALYLPAIILVRLFDLEENTPIWFALSVAAVATGCSVAVLLSRMRGFTWLSKLGARTLPVYLLHWYLLWAVALLLALIPRIPDAVVPLIVPILTIVAITGALLTNTLTRWIPGMYDRPQWLVRLGDRFEAQAITPPPSPR